MATPALQSDNPRLQSAAAHAQHLGETHGWARSTIRCVMDGLMAVLDGQPAGERVLLTEVRARPIRGTPNLRVAEVLTDLGLLDDDTTPAIRSWIDRSVSELPAGFADPIRGWLLVLLDGDSRALPRSPDSLYAYFKSTRSTTLITCCVPSGDLGCPADQ